MMIELLKTEHAVEVARLHIEGISTGFISSLGEKFVAALYESIAQSPHGFGFVAEQEGRIVGFVAFTTDLNGLYKSILKKNLFRFSLLLFRKLFSWNTIKKIAETLFYPTRSEGSQLPKAELLSIVVADSQRGKGLARSLIQKGLAECQSRDISSVKVLVAGFNEPANRLYQRTGFKKAAQIENHGVVSNIYVVSTDHLG